MNNNHEGMPFVPEEDLDLHEDFAPIIAENGVISPKVDPREATKLSVADTTFTRLDTVQDLMQIRSEEQAKEGTAQNNTRPAPKDNVVSKSSKQTAGIPPAKSTKQELTQPPADPVQDVGGKTQTIPVDPFNLQPVEDLLPAAAIQKDSAQKQTSTKSNVDKPVVKSQSIAQKAGKKSSRPAPEKIAERSTHPTQKPIEQSPQSVVRKPVERSSQPVVKKTPEPLRPIERKPVESVPPLSKEKPVHKSAQSVQQKTVRNDEPQSILPAKTSGKPPVEQKFTSRPQKRHRLAWVLAILCFLFLGTVGGVIPVEKIPFLRDLAYAMGFTKDDTARMSFLRALLTWTDRKTGVVPGDWENPESRAALWERLYGKLTAENEDEVGAFARMQHESGKTNLIDINALNALQRQRGWKLDGIRSSVSPIPGQETLQDPARVRDDKVNVRTEANQDKGEVYFGSDANSVTRNFQDGYDSVNTLKKIANPHIANGEPIDWLRNMTQRMMKTDLSLGGIDKELHGTQVNWGMNTSAVGEDKPHRDLYYAWISSRMSKYTSNLMLKKALADTAFMGADMPNTASNVLMFGGIQVDAVSLQEDQEAWKEYMEFERKCKEAQNTSASVIDDSITEFNNLVHSTSTTDWDFPAHCAAEGALSGSFEGTNFARSLGRIQQICSRLQTEYNKLRNECRMQIAESPSNCSNGISDTYGTHWTNFQQDCQTHFNDDFDNWWDTTGRYQEPYSSRIANGESMDSVKAAARQGFKDGPWKDTYGPRHTQEDFVSGLVSDSGFHRNQGKDVDITTMVDVVIDQNGGSSDYFPSIDAGESVKRHMEENKTL